MSSNAGGRFSAWGMIAAPPAHAFHLPPWAFHAITITATVLVIFALLRYRTRKLESRNRRLEETVRARTEQIEAQADELRTLDQIVQVINREVRLERLLDALLEQGMLLFPKAEKGAFLVSNGEQCEIVASAGYDDELLRGVRFTIEQAVHRYCESAELLGEGVYLSRNVLPLPGDAESLPQPKAMLAMEVARDGQLEGFLVFDNFSDPNAFGRSDVEKLSRLRDHAISAIAKARLLRQLEIKNREAEAANQAKSAFLANMSHELRTPLNSIIGFSEILVDRLEKSTEPKFVNFMRLILASGQHLLTLINDILDLSKIEAGKMEVFRETVSVRALVEGVCTIMRPLASKKEITFDIELPPEPLLVETDAGKFKQVLYNLLSNAVKFSPAGSVVHVAAEMKSSETLALTVRDEGIGIAPEDLDLIFEEFRQVDASVRRRYEGTGLGLSLVKKIVELQQGSVRVESEVGTGSRFTVELPVVSSVATEPAAGRGHEQVLVVEDEDEAWDVLRQHLVTAGYKPVRARYVDEAVNLAQLLMPAAVTLDLALPGGDGWDVLRRLKAGDDTRRIPVVIVSVSENRELGFALGADDYMVKPLEAATFVRRLQELIASGRAGSNPPSVLVIDDDPAVQAMVAEELGSHGIRSRAASSGDEGMRLAAEEVPDLIVLDLMMPGMSGFEVAQRLKSDPATRDIPIIVLTARDLAADERAALEASIETVVKKGEGGLFHVMDAIAQLRHVTPART